MKKIKYRCKCCGWNKELPAEWADQKPRFCMASICEYSVKKSKGKKSFRTNPEMLEITYIDLEVPKETKPKQVNEGKSRRRGK